MKVKVDTSIDPQQLFQSLESSYGDHSKEQAIRYSRCPVQRCPLFALLRALLSVSRAGTRAPLSVFRAAPTDQSSIIIPIIREFGSNHQQQSLESCKSII